MITSFKELTQYNIASNEGVIGRIVDCLFDEDQWVLRFLLVETGDWLGGERVYISPHALHNLELDQRQLTSDLTRDKIRNSPRAIMDRPLEREQEILLLNYFEWPLYWVEGEIPGTGPGGTGYPLVELAEEIKETNLEQNEMGWQPLHSMREVTDFHISARDGGIGKVNDFILDTDSWKLLYMIVDTGGWLTGKKVLLSPTWVQSIDWEESSVSVDLNKETIDNSPEYDPSFPLDQEFWSSLDDYYSRHER